MNLEPKTGNKMSWMNKQVSFYTSHSDNVGRAASLGEVLLNKSFSSLPIIRELRNLDEEAEDYTKTKVALKGRLPGFTPAAYLKSRSNKEEAVRSGIMQLDFDPADLQDYDVEDLKRCVFSLPFVAWCELSCSGKGFYALALIAEPERLKEYAEHCFNTLLAYGIKADTSKGRNVNDLRYISYDIEPMYREYPEPLKVAYFKPKEHPKNNIEYNYPKKQNETSSCLINKLLNELSQTQVGQRWSTVQKVAFTLGGKFDISALQEIKSTIIHNSAFAGEEEKYIKCAEVCFQDGSLKPLI